jgi:hypothetical protein
MSQALVDRLFRIVGQLQLEATRKGLATRHDKSPERTILVPAARSESRLRVGASGRECGLPPGRERPMALAFPIGVGTVSRHPPMFLRRADSDENP